MEAKIYRSEKMKEADYNYLLQKLQFNDNVRNQLLMFALRLCSQFLELLWV